MTLGYNRNFMSSTYYSSLRNTGLSQVTPLCLCSCCHLCLESLLNPLPTLPPFHVHLTTSCFSYGSFSETCGQCHITAMPYFHLFHKLSNMLLHIWLQVFAYFVDCLFYPKKKALSLSSYLFNSWDVTLAQ